MLTVAKFVNDLDRVVQKAIAEKGVKLAKGQCATIEDYKRVVGQCEGMVVAVDLARQMLRNIEIAEQDES